MPILRAINSKQAFLFYQVPGISNILLVPLDLIDIL
jgi:hypothetical protein